MLANFFHHVMWKHHFKFWKARRNRQMRVSIHGCDNNNSNRLPCAVHSCSSKLYNRKVQTTFEMPTIEKILLNILYMKSGSPTLQLLHTIYIKKPMYDQNTLTLLYRYNSKWIEVLIIKINTCYFIKSEVWPHNVVSCFLLNHQCAVRMSGLTNMITQYHWPKEKHNF